MGWLNKLDHDTRRTFDRPAVEGPLLYLTTQLNFVLYGTVRACALFLSCKEKIDEQAESAPTDG